VSHGARAPSACPGKAYLHACLHTERVTKTVALSDEAYAALARLKKPGESFSDVVQNLVARQRPRLGDALEQPSPAAEAHWAKFQKERAAARRSQASRVRLED
jgi:predicted CopG family antitoxin